MGQYYKVVNTTKGEVMTPHAFGSGAKLMEFSSDGQSIMQGLAILLADGNNRGGGDLRSDNPLVGSWAGDNIVITGDYADEGKFVPKKNHKQNLYGYSEENYKDISFDVRIVGGNKTFMRNGKEVTIPIGMKNDNLSK